MNTGFILLYRQIVEWEWYQNPNTFRVFLHILLMANYTEGRFEGQTIKRGQLVTSLPKLSQQTKLSIQNVRTAISHLISTGEITVRTTSKYRVITIVKYDEYQVDNRQNNSQLTGNQQATNRQEGENQQQYKKDIKREKGNNILSLKREREKFTPPTVDDVERYCDEKGIYGFNAQHFVDYYTARGWMIGKNKIKDWKACIRTWLHNDEKRTREKEQGYSELPY